MSVLPSRAVGDEDIERGSYYLALEGVTRHGIIEAVKFILRGSLKHTFFPSPVELRQQCDAAMEWHIQEERRVRQREEQQAENRRIAEVQATRTPQSRERVASIYQGFLATYDDGRQAAEDAERARVRAAYGMTEEVLAGLKNQPVPSNFEQVKYQAKSA